MTSLDSAAREAAKKLKQVAELAAAELDKTASDSEAVRVSQEHDRQTHETSRRVAEGGDGAEENGRVAAEISRVDAEAVRVLRDRKLMPRISVLVALPLALISLLPSIVGLFLLHREVANRCADAVLNRTAIRDTVLGGLPGIGAKVTKDGVIVKAGIPKNVYWLYHPEERDAAIKSAQSTLGRFPNIDC